MSNSRNCACPDNEGGFEFLNYRSHQVKTNFKFFQAYKRAISSIKKYPVPILSEGQAQELDGVGPRFATEIMIGINKHRNSTDTTDQSINITSDQVIPEAIKNKEMKEISKRRRDGRYYPEEGKGPWCIPICFELCKIETPNKEDITRIACKLVEIGITIAKIDDVWSASMQQLKGKSLVSNVKKSVYALTAEGKTVASYLAKDLFSKWPQVASIIDNSGTVVPLEIDPITTISNQTINSYQISDTNDLLTQSVTLTSLEDFNDINPWSNDQEGQLATELQKNPSSSSITEDCTSETPIATRRCYRETPPRSLFQAVMLHETAGGTATLARSSQPIPALPSTLPSSQLVSSQTTYSQPDSTLTSNQEYADSYHGSREDVHFFDLTQDCEEEGDGEGSTCVVGGLGRDQSQDSLSRSSTSASHCMSQKNVAVPSLLYSSQVIAGPPSSIPGLTQRRSREETVADISAVEDSFESYLRDTFGKTVSRTVSSTVGNTGTVTLTCDTVSDREASLMSQNDENSRERRDINNNRNMSKTSSSSRTSGEEKGRAVQKKMSDYIPCSCSQVSSEDTERSLESDPLVDVDIEKAEVVLIVDMREKKEVQNSVIGAMESRGLRCEVGSLAVGDFCWVARTRKKNGSSNSNKRNNNSNSNNVDDGGGDSGYVDVVLDCIAERKTNDDLCASIMDMRYVEQRRRMRDCGLRTRIYIIEGKLTGGNSFVAVNSAALRTALTVIQVTEGMHILHTRSMDNTLTSLIYLHKEVTRRFRTGDMGTRFTRLSDFNKKNGKVTARTVGELFAMQLKQIPGLGNEAVKGLAGRFGTLPSMIQSINEMGSHQLEEEIKKYTKRSKDASFLYKLFRKY